MAANPRDDAIFVGVRFGRGSFGSVGGLGLPRHTIQLSTRDIYNMDIKAVFTLSLAVGLAIGLPDNIMRGVLATPSYGLTCAWFWPSALVPAAHGHGGNHRFWGAVDPEHWPGGLYQNQVNSGAGQIHVALMGDPTLRMHVVAPPASVSAVTIAARSH